MVPNLYSAAWQQPRKQSSIYFRLGILPFVGWSALFHRTDITQAPYFGQNGIEDNQLSRQTDWKSTYNSALAALFILNTILFLLLFNDINPSLIVFKTLVKLWMIVLPLFLVRLCGMIYKVWQTRKGYYLERPQWKDYEWWRFVVFAVGLYGFGYQSVLGFKLATILFSWKWSYPLLAVACQLACSLCIAVSLEIFGRLFYKPEGISDSRSL